MTIPEPPDGTKLVVVPAYVYKSPFIAIRDDDGVDPGGQLRWSFLDGWNEETCATWEELQTMGTLHHIGPELGSKYTDEQIQALQGSINPTRTTHT